MTLEELLKRMEKERLIRLRGGVLVVALLVAGLVEAQEKTEEASGEKAPAAAVKGGADEAPVEEMIKPDGPGLHDMRKWVLADGTEFDGCYRSRMGRNIIMENAKGTQKKIEIDRFAPDDIEFFELANPPEFRLNFKNKSSKLNYSDRYVLTDMPVILLYEFGASAEKRSAGEYNHEVTLEFFAIASQRHQNNKYILLDRYSSSFVPSRENGESHKFWSPRVSEADEYSFRGLEARGKKYKGYLLIVTDKRGKVIDYKTSNEWLMDHVEELRKRSVGNYLDDTCKRVYPGRPTLARGGNYM